MSVVVGIDAGGTRTRCLVVDLDGERLGWAQGAGANLNSSADAEDALRSVLADAVPAGTAITALVLAAAGAGPAGAPRARAVAEAATSDWDVGALIVHSDVEAAFAAGSTEPDGTVVVAGTGAVAATIRGFRTARRVDGHGYLVGDRGSAFWLGTGGVRAVLAELDGTGPATALRASVLELVRHDPAVAGRADAAELTDAELIEAVVYAHPPAWLGAFAPLVESAGTAGDPLCRQLIDAAVAAVVATAERAHDGGPVVAVGGLVSSDGLIGRALRASLAGALDAEVRIVHDASPGAAALALRTLGEPGHAAADHLVTST